MRDEKDVLTNVLADLAARTENANDCITILEAYQFSIMHDSLDPSIAAELILMAMNLS